MRDMTNKLNEHKLDELRKKLNSLEISLQYNQVKGDDESIAEIHDEIYKTRQEMEVIYKKMGVK
jgi:hypothetical protein